MAQLRVIAVDELVDSDVVSMGKCVQCGKPWFMTRGQYQWWLTVGKAKALKIPRHCQSCRDLRKRLMSVRLHELADRVANGEFDFGDSDLIGIIKEFALEAEEYERRRRHVKTNPAEVQQPKN